MGPWRHVQANVRERLGIELEGMAKGVERQPGHRQPHHPSAGASGALGASLRRAIGS